jgi:hypothetical protein
MGLRVVHLVYADHQSWPRNLQQNQVERSGIVLGPIIVAFRWIAIIL